MRQMIFIRGTALVITGAMLMACGHQSVQTPALADTEWRLIEIDGSAPAIVEDRRPTLVLNVAEDRAVGSGGCNRYSGSFREGKDRVQFGPMMQTKIGCGDEINQSEQRFHAALARVARLRQRADQLELLDENGAILMRMQASASADAP